MAARTDATPRNEAREADASSAKDIISSSQKLSFLDLPPELRIIIYKHCLAFPPLMEACLVRDPFPTKEQLRDRIKDLSYILPREFGTEEHLLKLTDRECYRNGLSPAILATCRQILHEARHVLYSNRVFTFRECGDVAYFLTHIGRDNTALLSEIQISVKFDQVWWGYDFYPRAVECDVFARLAVETPDLQSLRIYDPSGFNEGPQWDAIANALLSMKSLRYLRINNNEAQDGRVNCPMEGYRFKMPPGRGAPYLIDFAVNKTRESS
jgi:2EXR family